MECLVYLVEDPYFTVASDDRYERVTRVLNRLAETLANPLAAKYEINGIKSLFGGGGQAGNLDLAKNFVDLAIAHLR